MKTKPIILIFLLAFMTFNASAFKIVITGMGNSHLYRTIVTDNNRIYCTGTGFLYCPASSDDSNAYSKTTGIKLNDVTNFVINEVKAGHSNGQINYKDKLETRWRTLPDDGVEIEINDDNIGGLENFK